MLEIDCFILYPRAILLAYISLKYTGMYLLRYCQVNKMLLFLSSIATSLDLTLKNLYTVYLPLNFGLTIPAEKISSPKYYTSLFSPRLRCHDTDRQFLFVFPLLLNSGITYHTLPFSHSAFFKFCFSTALLLWYSIAILPLFTWQKKNLTVLTVL